MMLATEDIPVFYFELEICHWCVESPYLSATGISNAGVCYRRGVYRVLLGKLEGWGQLGRPRSRRENNIKVCLQLVGCEDMDWIELALNRESWQAFLNLVMNLRIP
jgi:hypothetical protein